MDYERFVEDVLKLGLKILSLSTTIIISGFLGFLIGWTKGANIERNMIMEKMEMCKNNNGQYVLEGYDGNSYCNVNGLQIESFTSPNR